MYLYAAVQCVLNAVRPRYVMAYDITNTDGHIEYLCNF